jgi:hypothetical protein
MGLGFSDRSVDRSDNTQKGTLHRSFGPFSAYPPARLVGPFQLKSGFTVDKLVGLAYRQTINRLTLRVSPVAA